MSIDEYKACATRLQKHFLETHNVKLTRSQSLEAVAVERGRRNWNVLAAEAQQTQNLERLTEPFWIPPSDPDVHVSPSRRRDAARTLTNLLALRSDMAPMVLATLATWGGLRLTPGELEDVAQFIYSANTRPALDIATMIRLMNAADSVATRAIGGYIASLWLVADDSDLTAADQTIKRQLQEGDDTYRLQLGTQHLPSNTFNPFLSELVSLAKQFSKIPKRLITFLIEHGKLDPLSQADLDYAVAIGKPAVAYAPDAVIALYTAWSTSDVASVRALGTAIGGYLGRSLLSDIKAALTTAGALAPTGAQVDWTAEKSIDVLELLAQKELSTTERATASSLLNRLKNNGQPATLVTVVHALAVEPQLRAFGEAAAAKLFPGPAQPSS